MNHYEALVVSRMRIRELQSERDHDKLVQTAVGEHTLNGSIQAGVDRSRVRLPGWLAVIGRWNRPAPVKNWTESPCVGCPIPE